MDLHNQQSHNGCMYTAHGGMVCGGKRPEVPKVAYGIEGFTTGCVNPRNFCTAGQIDAWLANSSRPQCCVVRNDIPLNTAFSGGQPMCTAANKDRPCTSLGLSSAVLRDYVLAAKTDGKTEKACCKLVI